MTCQCTTRPSPSGARRRSRRELLRTSRLLAAALLGAVALVGCDDGDPVAPGLPELRGAYAADWDLTVTESAGGQSETWTCPGSITIGEQAGGGFSGSFLVTEMDGCELTTGEIVGEVEADGSLSFQLVPDEVSADGDFFEAISGCDALSADEAWAGLFAEGELTASASALVECEFEHFGDVILEMDLNLRATRG